MLLSLTQQVVLVPVFLWYWSSETLAAWLTIFSAGNLVLIADGGIHIWSLNRFLSFKVLDDCDRRTSRYYATALRLYLWLMILVVVLLLLTFQFLHPSKALGFSDHPDFDLAFILMAVGMASTLPVNIAGALYRARGLYGRIVGIQCWGLALAQVGELAAIITNGSVLAVTAAYLIGQIVTVVYILAIDMRRAFPFVRPRYGRLSLRWTFGQLRGALPFGVMNLTELALTYAPVLLVSAFVSDRVLIAQWGLTRTIASLLRGLSLQMTLPLAAELGHDQATGMKENLASLYARGSLFIALFASAVTSAAIIFWPDFFALWTHGTIPFDPVLTYTLLIGSCVAAPSILALSYANYSNRGVLLLWTKSLQLAIFLMLSVTLIPRIGLLGAAIAVVSCDILAQWGILSSVIMRETLKHPLRHVGLLVGIMIALLSIGTGLGAAIQYLLPGVGLFHFLIECVLWVIVMGAFAAPFLKRGFCSRLKVVTKH